jgi:hypothetical protein
MAAKLTAFNCALDLYHGTTIENAINIQKSGFKQSKDGMLGAGVYLSRELTKVESYPIGVPEHNKAIIKLKVNIGRWISIDKQGHQYQRSWASNGYDSAWVPAKCGMVASGLEEWCVYDPKRITNIKIVKPNLKTVSCHYSKWFKSGGCKWKDLEYFREAHEKEECLYRWVKCHNSKNGCDWNGKEKHKPIHELEHCQFKLERCDLCEHFFVKTNLEKHKNEECINRIVLCPNKKLGCHWKIKYCEELVHVHKQCLFRQEKCQNFKNGCYWIGMQKGRQAHESEECQYFLVKCAFCKNYFVKMEILQHTNEECADGLVSCPNKDYGCDLMIKRKDLNHHYQKNICSFQKEKCHFCNEDFYFREKQNHLQNTCTFVTEKEKCHYCNKMFPRKKIHKHKHGFVMSKKNCLKIAIEKGDHCLHKRPISALVGRMSRMDPGDPQDIQISDFK